MSLIAILGSPPEHQLNFSSEPLTSFLLLNTVFRSISRKCHLSDSSFESCHLTCQKQICTENLMTFTPWKGKNCRMELNNGRTLTSGCEDQFQECRQHGENRQEPSSSRLNSSPYSILLSEQWKHFESPCGMIIIITCR